MARRRGASASAFGGEKGDGFPVGIGQKLIFHVLVDLAFQHIAQVFLQRRIKVLGDAARACPR